MNTVRCSTKWPHAEHMWRVHNRVDDEPMAWCDGLPAEPGHTPAPSNPRRFWMVRDVDHTGTSGTGVVVEGVEWSDGSVVIRWLGRLTSTARYNSVTDLIEIHGHNGATRIVWLD